MSPRWTSYVIPKPPKRGAQKCKVSEIWTIRWITPKRYEIGCQLLWITNRKSHTGFRLVPTAMTLNDLERRNSHYFAFFSPNSIALQDHYVTAEDRPIASVKYCLPVPVFHFWPKLTHPAARSLCDRMVLSEGRRLLGVIVHLSGKSGKLLQRVTLWLHEISHFAPLTLTLIRWPVYSLRTWPEDSKDTVLLALQPHMSMWCIWISQIGRQ